MKIKPLFALTAAGVIAAGFTTPLQAQQQSIFESAGAEPKFKPGDFKPAPETIKTRYGTCSSSSINSDETIEVPGMGGREPKKLPRQILGEILEPRMEEIFMLVQREIYRAGMENMINSGMVMTGGGALLRNMDRLLTQVTGVPCCRRWASAGRSASVAL